MRLSFDVEVARPGGFRLSAAEDLEAGAIGIAGPSGSGKSTLLDALAGFLPARSFRLDGEELACLPPERRGIGLVPQEPALFPHLTVRENLAYSPRASDVDRIAAALGLGPLLGRRPRTLSGGERRRVALGRALASRPRLLLLDEPFGGLDETRRREAMSLVAGLRADFPVPLVLVSHDPSEVAALAGFALRLEAGRVAARGPVHEVLRAAEARYDNYFTGVVTGPRQVDVDGQPISLLLPGEARGRIRLACYAHDLLLSRERPPALSARNVRPVKVKALREIPDAVLVDVAPPSLTALVTPEAARELELAPGAPAFLILKATSIAFLGAA